MGLPITGCDYIATGKSGGRNSCSVALQSMNSGKLFDNEDDCGFELY